MHFKQLTTEDLHFFQNTIGIDFVLTQEHERIEDYSHDHTEDLYFLPTFVLLPASANEIASILAYCNHHNICVTPRGAGTGLSGGALAVYGGIVLSTERLNKIIQIDTTNFQATVEPAVINEVLQNAVQEHGLFYPPDPASKGSCFLGGNVAHASGGPRALKYGTTRDYILNLEVVLASGDIIWTGANTLKYSTGYNLTHLLIGSEGTLGIVTKIVVKLISFPSKNMLMLTSFPSPEDACKAVAGIFMGGCQPSVCEFVEPDAFRLSAAFTGLPFEVKENVAAYLLLEADGNNEENIQVECEKIAEILETYHCHEILLASSSTQKDFFWRLRRTIGEATKKNNVYKEEDTVVPRGELAALYTGVKEIAARYGVRTICYGHAGDGNLHVNILKDDLPDSFWQEDIKQAIEEIFLLCKKLGGTISGEHGIGFVQKEFMPLVMKETNIDLMRKIKIAFDPNQILNPGKIF
jgi:glycolate oxidase